MEIAPWTGSDNDRSLRNRVAYYNIGILCTEVVIIIVITVTVHVYHRRWWFRSASSDGIRIRFYILYIS